MITLRSKTNTLTRESEMSNIAYFATDGSFGDALNIELIDVSKWTEEDWNEVQDETDEYRISVARSIAERYATKD